MSITQGRELTAAQVFAAREMSETDLLRSVLDMCRALRLRTAHFRPARTDRGWVTPVQGDGAGFPDLVIVGQAGVLYRELKAERGRLTPEQKAWLGDLHQSGADAGVWRPSDWMSERVRDELERIL